MNKRRIYDVSPKGNQWTVRERNAERAVANFDHKVEAVKRAREIANNLPFAQIVIRRQDGTIQTEHTYGDDPFPPPG